MADANEERLKVVQGAEKDLLRYLKDKASKLPDILHFLAQYRLACEEVILQDFEYAASKALESRLWDFHGKVNNVFRKDLKQYKEAAGKKKPVEHRKATKHFLDFIKSSQRFYRGYLQRLASRFGGIPELEAVANKLTLSTLSIDEPTQVLGFHRQLILLSCHQMIVQLGDLSRWRESQLVITERNWGPAVGYYELARAIYPASGASFNQLAVIALADKDHLHATYHLYRALAVDEPHPSAKSNLEIEFRKLQEISSKDGEKRSDHSHETRGPGEDLVDCFIRLHARCYNGIEYPEHEADESAVFRHLKIDLSQRSLEGIFRDPTSTEMVQSFFLLLRVNVKTFITLLQVLTPELERCVGDVPSHDSKPGSGSVKLTAVTRRALPYLRHYSSWLISNASILASGVGGALITDQIRLLWRTYANTLTLLVSKFPVSGLPSPIEYLLEEDEDTLGFKPFDNEQAQRRYIDEDTGSQKPKWHDRGVQRQHPNLEMLGRVRDLLTDGMILQSQEDVPIQLTDTTFVYLEDDTPPNEIDEGAHSTTRTDPDEITHVDETTFPHQQSSRNDKDTQVDSLANSMDLDSERMVDDLVGDSEKLTIPNPSLPYSGQVGNETSYGLFGSSIARELGDLHDQPQRASQPLLPSILNSPFAPQPGETSPELRGPFKASSLAHSRHNSQTTTSSRQPNKHTIGSSMSSMPEPTNPNGNPNIGQPKHPGVHATFPHKINYTTGGISATSHHGNDYKTVDDCHFISPTIDWGCSGSVKEGSNAQTPPNGQGIG